MVLVLLTLAALPAFARAAEPDWAAHVGAVFPQSDRIGPLEGDPPAAAVYAGGERVGYVLLTDRVVDIPGYSGRPVSTLVGVDASGRIAGLHIVAHQEPILGAGVSEAELARFVAQYRDLDLGYRTQIGGVEREGYVTLDGLTGATITAMALDASIEAAAREVAVSRGLLGNAREGAETAPAWRHAWRSRPVAIGLLLAGLGMLLVVLVFQDWFVRRPRLIGWIRRGFLVFTATVIGWWGLAQLSVLNVLTFFHAVTHDFRWETFLADPLLFILWSFVAVAMLLWGRGVYCGWLCPYGALQELANYAGRALGIRRLELPAVVHERLWAVKYVIFLALFGLSLESLTLVRPYAEVEPFRTAITLRFDRAWPFVLYAAGFIAISVVNPKFYCKYVCPLGAALAIPARLRLLDWLRRRKECGRPCQICAVACHVRAIGPTGEIDPNECHHCLDCQVIYWNDRQCPPLVDKRRRRERSHRALVNVGGGSGECAGKQTRARTG
ncbi:4Fe-4S binding protein [Arhodomonas sp. AD133]|uniref:4Fe-4S binding protein n=1 Tax=Arhodomonas sp. AD133 TaxID=3415009 RepID=UPI003EB76FCD